MSACHKALRIWIGIVALAAVGNSISCFLNEQFTHLIHDLNKDQATFLFGRAFGTWTLLASVVRVSHALDFYNKTLYLLNLFSFVLAFLYFVNEVFVFKTASLQASTLLPLCISGFTTFWLASLLPTAELKSKLKQN